MADDEEKVDILVQEKDDFDEEDDIPYLPSQFHSAPALPAFTRTSQTRFSLPPRVSALPQVCFVHFCVGLLYFLKKLMHFHRIMTRNFLLKLLHWSQLLGKSGLYVCEIKVKFQHVHN